MLQFGDKVTIKRRVRNSQVKGVVTSVYFDEIDGAVKYDIAPTNGATHLKDSEFKLVKSAGDDFSRAKQKESDMIFLIH